MRLRDDVLEIDKSTVKLPTSTSHLCSVSSFVTPRTPTRAWCISSRRTLVGRYPRSAAARYGQRSPSAAHMPSFSPICQRVCRFCMMEWEWRTEASERKHVSRACWQAGVLARLGKYCTGAMCKAEQSSLAYMPHQAQENQLAEEK